MKYIYPSAEYWQQGDDLAKHVARCARVCYASEKTTDNEKMVVGLEKRGHMSMFRHESHYYIIRHTERMANPWVLHFLQNSVYCGVYVVKKQRTYVSTNGQFVREHKEFFEKYMGNNEVTEAQFITEAVKTGYPAVMMLVRFTVCVQTQISTSRELNRTSPNAIAEQSTRYVNFGKRGGITICKPVWMDCKRQPWGDAPVSALAASIAHSRVNGLLMRFGFHVADALYRLMVRLGLPPQYARGILPLETATKVIYTYSGYEWRNIFDLRLRQKTGKAHPEAVQVASLIHRELTQALAIYGMQKMML